MLRTIINSTDVAKVRSLLKDSRNIVITTHVSPDGDAIGSSLALYEYLKRKGKQVNVIVPNYFPDFLHWMHDADKIIQYDRHRAQSKLLIQGADLIVALDYNSLSRVEELQLPLRYSKCPRLMIDHHESPDKFCTIQISRPEMSSTCELLYRLFVALDETRNISLHCAEDLYAGMCTDTGRFTYGSNDPEIFVIISELMRKGIDKDSIIRNIYNQNSEGRYRLMGHILSEKLELFPEIHSALFALDRNELKRFKYKKGDAEGFVNIPLEIKGIDVSVSLREDTERDQIFVSLRSVGDITVDGIASRHFNGGGHQNAAGGRLFCPMAEALEFTRRVLKEELGELFSPPAATTPREEGEPSN